MRKCDCIYTKAMYYAIVYTFIIVAAFALGFVNNYFGFHFEFLNIIGFGALVIPTVPLQGLLFNYDMLLTDGVNVFPSDKGLMLAHGIWFAFFYFTYLAFLLYKKKK